MKKTKYAVDTKVPVNQTRNEIETALSRFGARSFAFATQPDSATVLFEFDSRRIRFDLPLPSETSEARTAKLHRERWRALFLSIKAKLVSVDAGIETFEEAFLAHIVLADGQNLYEAVKEGIEQQYVSGKVGPLLLEGPRK